MAISQMVEMLSLTDGRDKSYKFLQGLTKVLAFYSQDPSTSSKMSKLASSLGEGRSIMRFAKWTSNIEKIEKLALKGIKNGFETMLIIELLRVLGDMGYVIGDNLSYFSKYKVLPLNPKDCTKYGKNAQFWGFFCQIIMDVTGILKLKAEDNKQTAYLNLVKNMSDILVILFVVQYLPREIYNPSAGIQGLLLTLSGGIATYANWGKAEKKAKAQ